MPISNLSGMPSVPSYIAITSPAPTSARVPWYLSIAPVYASIFLWFAFWDAVNAPQAPGGILSQGAIWALVSIGIASLVCYFLFFLVPGLLGQKTGYPLYIVTTSTFGVTGAVLVPGMLMVILQLGWLAISAYFSAHFLSAVIPWPRPLLMVWWCGLAGIVGLGSIRILAVISALMSLISLAILIGFAIAAGGSFSDLKPELLPELLVTGTAAGPMAPLSVMGVFFAILTYMVGFFATAGTAAADFGANSPNQKHVGMGGIMGVVVPSFVAAGFALLVMAGVYSNPELVRKAMELKTGLSLTNLIPLIFGNVIARWLWVGLILGAFPAACFCCFLAANSLKTILSEVNPVFSVNVGVTLSVFLAMTGLAVEANDIFSTLGAVFAPMAGAMVMDYVLAGRDWTGPRAQFNPAGWIALLVGFPIGILYMYNISIPAAPVCAFFAGAFVYFFCSKAGLVSEVLSTNRSNALAPSEQTYSTGWVQSSRIPDVWLTFHGRLSLHDWWLKWGIFSVALALFGLFLTVNPNPIVVRIYCTVQAFCLVPMIAMNIKRLHDLNMSGWWFLALLVPVLNIYVASKMMVIKGSPEANRFGPSPVHSGPSQTNAKPAMSQAWFTFEGRVSRTEWWLKWGIFSVITAALNLCIPIIENTILMNGLLLLQAFCFLPMLAMNTKRLHDMNMSGWWLLGVFVPILNLIIGIRLMFIKGTNGNNRFGPDPLIPNSLESKPLLISSS